MRKKNEYSRIIQCINDWNKESKGAQIQLFHHAVERNIHSFYCSSSSSSQSMGDAFSESGLSRDEVQIIGRIEEDCATKEKFSQAVEKMLLDMKIDYLDLLIHPPDITNLVPALEQCRTQGKILETAVSTDYNKHYSEDELKPENVTFENFELTVANLKTLTFRKTASEEVPKMLFLKGKFFEDHEVVERMAGKYGLSPDQFFLTWLLNHPGNFHLMISGGKEEMDSSAKALHTKIIEQDWNKFPTEL